MKERSKVRATSPNGFSDHGPARSTCEICCLVTSHARQRSYASNTSIAVCPSYSSSARMISSWELSTESDDVFKVYTAHKRGSLNPKLWKPEFCVPAGASLADAVDAQDDMQIVTRLEAEDDLDADDDADADDDDDSEVEDDNEFGDEADEYE